MRAISLQFLEYYIQSSHTSLHTSIFTHTHQSHTYHTIKPSRLSTVFPSSQHLDNITKIDIMQGFAITALALLSLATASPVPGADVLETLEGRQSSCGEWTPETTLDGDGSPRQRYLHKQLSVRQPSSMSSAKEPGINPCNSNLLLATPKTAAVPAILRPNPTPLAGQSLPAPP